jgi:hypothetical protein
MEVKQRKAFMIATQLEDVTRNYRAGSAPCCYEPGHQQFHLLNNESKHLIKKIADLLNNTRGLRFFDSNSAGVPPFL